MIKSYGQIARRYSKALFEVAFEANAVSEICFQAHSLIKILSAEIVKFFSSPIYSESEKIEALNEVMLTCNIHSALAGTLRTMLVNNRFVAAQAMLKEFIKNADKQMDILRAHVYSARALLESEFLELETALSGSSRKKVILMSHIDESCKAGFVIKIGNTIIDASLRSRITDLRESLSQGV